MAQNWFSNLLTPLMFIKYVWKVYFEGRGVFDKNKENEKRMPHR